MVSKLFTILVGPDTRLTYWRAFFTALAASILLSFAGVFDHSLWTPDEPRVAEVGREMLVNGEFVVPTLAGKPFLEKPPLYWWVMAGLYRLFGVSDGVARSTSAVAGILTLMLVFDVTRRIADPFAGVTATMVTATMAGFYNHFHRVVVDPWLALFVMAGYWGFVVASFCKMDSSEEKTVRPSPLGIFVVYLAGGLAFLVKGPIGPGLLVAPLVVAIPATKRWNFLRSWVHIPGLLIFLSLCLWWPLMLYLQGGKELLSSGFIIPNILYRIFPKAAPYYQGGHGHSFWYYLQCPSEIIPWLITLPAVGHWLWRKRWPPGWNEQALVFLGSIFPIGIILLSIPGTKRMLYLLPLYAPLGIVIGAWVATTSRTEYAKKIDRYTHIILFVFSALFVLGALVAGGMAYFGGAEFFPRFFHAALQAKPSASVFFLLFGSLLIAGIDLTIHGVRLWKSSSPGVGLICAWFTLIAFVFGGSLYYLLGDGIKNLHVMTRDLQAMRAFPPELIGYRLDQTTMGFIPYETGLVPRNITTPEKLNHSLQETPVGKVLMFEKVFSQLPRELRSRLQSLRCWHFADQRSYCLYEVIPPLVQKETPGEEDLLGYQ